jgi:hypothetical protein
MKKLILLASMLAFTATASEVKVVDPFKTPGITLSDAPRPGIQERLAALEMQVFGKPSVAPRVVPDPRVDTEASLKAKADRLAAREERMKANPALAAKIKANEERRAAALAAREARLNALGGSKVLSTGQPVKPLNPSKPVK